MKMMNMIFATTKTKDIVWHWRKNTRKVRKNFAEK